MFIDKTLYFTIDRNINNILFLKLKIHQLRQKYLGYFDIFNIIGIFINIFIKPIFIFINEFIFCIDEIFILFLYIYYIINQ